MPQVTQAQSKKAKKSETSGVKDGEYQGTLDQEAELDAYMEQQRIAPVPISELMKQAEDLKPKLMTEVDADLNAPDTAILESATPIATGKDKGSRLPFSQPILGSASALATPEDDMAQAERDDELRELMSPHQSNPSKFKGKGIKPHIPAGDYIPEDDNEYPESFASQQETAHLREEMEVIMQRLEKHESDMKALLKEREKLPMILGSMREDMNRQLTLMLDKLQIAKETEVKGAAVSSAAATVEEVRSDMHDQLTAASSFAQAPPSSASPIATGQTLRGKRRFKTVK